MLHTWNEYVNYSSKQKQPSTESPFRARLIRENAGRGSKPQRSPKYKHLSHSARRPRNPWGHLWPHDPGQCPTGSPAGELSPVCSRKNKSGSRLSSNLEMQRNTVLNPGSFLGLTEFNALGVKPELMLPSLTREATRWRASPSLRAFEKMREDETRGQFSPLHSPPPHPAPPPLPSSPNPQSQSKFNDRPCLKRSPRPWLRRVGPRGAIVRGLAGRLAAPRSCISPLLPSLVESGVASQPLAVNS